MKVLGKNVVVFIDNAGVNIVYGCALSCNLNLVTEFIETSVSGTGNFATFLPTKNSFTGSLEGLTTLEEPAMLSLPDLRARQIAQTPLSMKFVCTDEAGNVYTEQATFYISSSSYTGSFDDMSHYSVELQGTGILNPHGSRVLRETGDFILTETGDFILTEN